MNIKLASLKGAEATGLRILSVGGLILASLGVCAAEDAQQKVDDTAALPSKEMKSLDPTTILANRMETDISKVGSSVTVLDIGLLEEQGIRNLDEALKFVPGVVSDSVGGQRGSTSDLYIRGTKTAHAHVVVDGMRISDANSAAVGIKQFMGSNNLNGLTRVEVLRGPQGALYGGDSIGGVVGLYTAQGEGDYSGNFRLEGGSFHSWNAMFGMQGTSGDLSYSLGLGYERTDNDLPHNEFEMFSYALRLDYAVNESLNVGMTLRGADSTYQGPTVGDYYSGPDDTDLRYTLGTLFAEYEVNDLWVSKLTFGFFDQESNFKSRAATPGYSDPSDPYYVPPTAPPTISYTNDEQVTKAAIYWDNTVKWNEQNTTVAGLVYENSDYNYENSYASTDDRTRKQYGLYANHVWDVTDNFNLSGGARWEDYSDDGKNGYNDDVVTWRAASAYTVSQTDSILRASVGRGFRLPAFTEMYGYGAGEYSPLDPEESLGWDFGVEQPFCDGQYKVGVTYFANRIENAIVSNSYPLTGYSNEDGVSETSGIETSAEGHFLDERLSVMLTYTWLDRSLVDMPKHSGSLRIHGDISDKLGAGLTASYLGSRSYGGNDLDAYTLVNLYGNYKVSENVTLDARVENLLNKDYEYYNGYGSVYPGRGIGLFGGVTFNW
jgi:vitamin B12 transporter